MDNGMRVTCRFLQDALNAVVASYLQLHRRRFARIPETRRLFMYSKLTEYMNNYDRAPRRRGREESGTRERRRERETGKRERKRGELDLIDKVDLSATRGRVYVHLASFFRSRLPAAILGPGEPFVSSTTRHYPRRKRPVVHHVLSFTCSTAFSSLVFVLSSTSTSLPFPYDTDRLESAYESYFIFLIDE